MRLNQHRLKDPVDAKQVTEAIQDLREALKQLPIYVGNGSPINIQKANVGSIYLRLDGGANTTLYVKESDDGGVSGWVAK